MDYTKWLLLVWVNGCGKTHTQWVADKAKALAEKYGANTEKVYCAALLHDLGDSKYERGHEEFETWSKDKAEEILLKAGFSVEETKEILEAIRTHSSRPGNPPTTLEGKVLATADGMWHLQTSFFPVICYVNGPDTTHSYEEQLQAKGIDTLLIVGAVTSVCCEASARDAAELQYKVTMVSDALIGHSFGLHEATLATFFRCYGDVRPTGDTVEILEVTA